MPKKLTTEIFIERATEKYGKIASTIPRQATKDLKSMSQLDALSAMKPFLLDLFLI